MPVVINELEIIVAPPESPTPPQQAAPAAAPALTPKDIASLLERRIERQLRLFAH
jgi:hypothetical protein